MWRRLGKLAHDVSGGVAPTVALSLFGLVAAGGIAFDYARLAAMDTELQQAADNAALAAATQLDRADDSQDRATEAITGASANRLAANLTKFANDGDGEAIEIATIVFCSEFDDSEPDDMDACTIAEEQSDSRFVMVTTQARTANYALTPIVAAFSSGAISATAVAGVESSICNVAPLLVCTPNDDFPTTDDIGKGMVMKTAGGASWAPGNYGYLDFGSGNNAVIAALMGHGLNGCQNEDDNQTEPGNKNATDAINTRMDVYGGTGQTSNPNVCKVADGTGCPAENTRKDMTIQMTFERRVATSAAKPVPPACGAPAGGSVNGAGRTTYTTSFAQNVAAKQFGRDTCHYSSCTDGNFGNGDWPRDAYIAANHPGQTATAIAAAIGGGASAGTLTRYQVYQWEIANKANGRLGPVETSLTEDAPTVQGSNTTYTFRKQCAFNQPRLASAAYPAQKDRRILPVVAANCDNLKGKGEAFEDYVILRVFDVFLTEPSLQRSAAQAHPGGTAGTDDKEIYGEVVGPAQTFEGGSGFQYYSRNKPYLVR